MIVVTGATGTVGGEVARQLIATGERPRLLVRSPEKARHFAGKAEILRGDLSEPDTLPPAFRDADRLFLVSAGLDGPRLEKNAIAAARQAGIRHVVKLSVIGADAPELIFSRWHQESEQALMNSGLAWTMLRPGNFMTNAFAWAPTIKSQSAFYQPTGDGKFAPIDPVDIGGVAVKALTETGHDNAAYAMTGPEALSAAQQAEQLSAAIGRSVRFVDVPPEAAKEVVLKMGMPEAYVAALLDLMAFIKAGKAAAVIDPSGLLGRKPTTWADWCTRNAAAFR